MGDTLLSAAPPSTPAAPPAVGDKNAANPPAVEPQASTPPAAATPPAPPAPVELKLPEGFKAEDLGDYTKLATELKLDSPAAQKVVDHFLKLDAGRNAKALEAFEARSKQWVEAVKADKDVGGANFEASKVAAVKAMVRFGGDELRAALNESGYGDHPALVKFFVQVGKALAEDRVAGAHGGAAPAPLDREARLKAFFTPTASPKE